MEEPLKISIRDVNPHIVCSLCAGYFIDATTITECLHTFCKSCIVKYLESSKQCPQCNIKIHETQPLFNLRADRTLQDVVYKLVPGLFEREEDRKEEFYRSRGLGTLKKEGLMTKGTVAEEDEGSSHCLTSLDNQPQGHRYRHDEQVCLCLERYSRQSVPHKGSSLSLRALEKKFVRCSVRVLVSHLKEMLSRKLNKPTNLELEVLCGEELLQEEMSMKQIWLMFWHKRESPMLLYYRFKTTESPLNLSEDR
ncbi:polycomb group RING finger protein 1-like isoform X2 [Liolophura sinensis]|uniref:polycomb group RING finger protein 1-like isoform X2 n=1 Tax=Liolophura sinensis TaxID=3198878 RepID=UPI0031581BF2